MTKVWTSGRVREDGLPARRVWPAMKRGLACRCPACGEGRLFNAYLKVTPVCSACGEDLSHQRADDAPPYFTILIVGHIIVPLVLFVEMNWHPDVTLQMLVWLPLTAILALLILPPVKGAVVGYQWANYMHGFNPLAHESEERDPAYAGGESR
ncbi:DUF983 domain-containing protein [Oryzibacter oryziterrae]|uniref:DUF983 domain-containing protein n=1 Tax=Oryzibacter oryziterrae TaxID=2766474 RepID=UPI001F3D2816|nr:DUF983 domain-containing protein [Oryzibacter oryziterrae]